MLFALGICPTIAVGPSFEEVIGMSVEEVIDVIFDHREEETYGLWPDLFNHNTRMATSLLTLQSQSRFWIGKSSSGFSHQSPGDADLQKWQREGLRNTPDSR
jgi:hypothetical protein